LRRLFRRRVEPQPPPGATPDEAATQPITAIHEEDTAIREEEVVTRPGRRPPTIWPWLLALLLLVLAGIAAAYLLTRDDDDDAAEPTSVTVPDVVGDDVGDAMRELATNGLTGQVVRIASNRPREEVIRQRPRAGAAIERGGRVALVVSEGPPTARVPDVVGLPLADAFRRIEAAQLRPQARRVFSSRPRGRVVRQRPAAGTELEREQVVSLTVSRGRERVAAPALVGLREAQAGTRLRSAGLKANAVRVASSEPAGTVVAQNPTAGERVPRGSAVRINVSRGPSATTTTTTATPTVTTTTRTTTATTTTPTGTASSAATVPDVIGLDEPTARSRLRQAGFAARTVTRNTPDPAEDGIVLDQRPVAGTPARAGTQVTITVGVLTP
jgi:beta-lactam-binding protein with PASTA domain